MTISQVLPHLLKSNLVTLREAPKNPNTASPRYNLNAHCAYHSESLGHDRNDCWVLKNKLQDLPEEKEIEFDAPEIPNVITAPIPKHGRGVNTVEDDVFVAVVDELVTPLLTAKRSLLKAGLLSGCGQGCHLYLSLPNGCHLLKAGVHRLMDDKEIFLKRLPFQPLLTRMLQ